ncbi:hypothetical protein HU200_029288 [Digitaria exilis]|uniref:Uncharacterized protein n=1 Tax=Digitaria exilis TaxID=1010633 RepID=A0A835ERV4_9POAL|nr:hypothetical protein HU200_029288 [Digitaria exilis]
MYSSSTDSYSVSDYEMIESPPPAVMSADEEEIMYALQNTLNIEDPKMKGPVIVDAVPSRVVPYGGKEPIPFDKVKLDLLRSLSVPVKALSIRDRKKEVGFPVTLKSHQAYKEGDWKAFMDRGVHGRRKDMSYRHREYKNNFRSKLHVKEFLDTNGPVTGMFRGKRLHKKVQANPLEEERLPSMRMTTFQLALVLQSGHICLMVLCRLTDDVNFLEGNKISP